MVHWVVAKTHSHAQYEEEEEEEVVVVVEEEGSRRNAASVQNSAAGWAGRELLRRKRAREPLSTAWPAGGGARRVRGGCAVAGRLVVVAWRGRTG